ncbi:MAG: type II secretion system F family protein [Thermotogota bacterium]
MKKLYKFSFEEDNNVINTYLLEEYKNEIYKLIEGVNIKVINEKVDNLYFDYKKIDIKEMKIICENFYLLLSSGLNLYESLKFLIQNKQLSKYTRGVLTKSFLLIKKGKNAKVVFSSKSYHQYFLYIMNISSTKDILLKSFKTLIEYYNDSIETKNNLQKSTIYPLTVLTSILVILTTMNIFIIPKLSSMLDISLNMTTTNTLLYSFGFIFFILIIFSILSKKNDNYYLYIPIFGNLFRNYTLYKFTRDINILLKNKFTIDKALNKVIENMNSRFLTDRFLPVILKIEKGKNLENAFENVKNISEISISLSLSKFKGNYDDVFDFLEKQFKNNFNNTSDKIKKMIEPIFIIILGIIILSIAYEIFQKVYIGGISGDFL